MKCFRLSDFGAVSDGSANSFEAIKQCFIKASTVSDSIVEIDPGEYLVDSFESIPLASHVRVYADGAVFRFPRDLGDNKILEKIFIFGIIKKV